MHRFASTSRRPSSAPVAPSFSGPRVTKGLRSTPTWVRRHRHRCRADSPSIAGGAPRPTGRSSTVCRADAAVGQGSTSDTRALTIAAIKDQAPFVVAEAALAESLVFKSPLEYSYGSKGEPTSETTQNGVEFSSRLSRGEFADIMATFEKQHAALPRAGIRIIRSFQPDPSVIIVRWSVQWRKGMSDPPAVCEISSKYTLDREGLLSSQEDSWEVLPSKSADSTDSPPSLQDGVSLAMARRPPATLPLLAYLPAFRLGLWETLKSNENYGGQLTREEFDVFAMQLVYACVGLGASVALLAGRLAYLIVLARS